MLLSIFHCSFFVSSFYFLPVRSIVSPSSREYACTVVLLSATNGRRGARSRAMLAHHRPLNRADDMNLSLCFASAASPKRREGDGRRTARARTKDATRGQRRHTTRLIAESSTESGSDAGSLSDRIITNCYSSFVCALSRLHARADSSPPPSYVRREYNVFLIPPLLPTMTIIRGRSYPTESFCILHRDRPAND